MRKLFVSLLVVLMVNHVALAQLPLPEAGATN